MINPPASAQPLNERLAIGAALALAVAFLAATAGQNMLQIDLLYFRTAGAVWSAGGNPYGADFLAAAAPISREWVWVYPPQWWPAATLLAATPLEVARPLWRVLNLALLTGGAALLWRAAAPSGQHVPPLARICFLLFLGFAEPVHAALGLGQTSLLSFFGFAALMDGMRRGRRGWQIAGLMVLLLKPQIGAVFIVLTLVRSDTRLAALFALVVSALIAAPVLLIEPDALTTSLQGLLHNLSIYPSLKWNRPLEIAGLSNLIALATLQPTPAWVTLAWPVAIGLASLTDASIERFWTVSLGSILFFLPLHGYDFVLAAALLLQCRQGGTGYNGLAAIAVLLIARPYDFSPWFGTGLADLAGISPAMMAYTVHFTAAGLLLCIAACTVRGRSARVGAMRLAPGA